MWDSILYYMRKEPLEVQFNDTAKHKYLTIPSKMDIEPGQKVFPIAVDERWGEDWYPTYLKLDELLERINDLISVAEEIATDYDVEKSSEGEFSTELAWLSEGLGEVDHDKITQFRKKLTDQYNLDEDSDNMPDTEQMTKYVIRKKHGKKFKDKYQELGEWQEEKIADKLEEMEGISHITNQGTEVKIHFTNATHTITVPLSVDAVAEQGGDEEVIELVKFLTGLYSKREERFVNFAEELGYEHRFENTNLGFHQFNYEDYVVEVPMTLPHWQDIDIMKKQN